MADERVIQYVYAVNACRFLPCLTVLQPGIVGTTFPIVLLSCA